MNNSNRFSHRDGLMKLEPRLRPNEVYFSHPVPNPRSEKSTC